MKNVTMTDPNCHFPQNFFWGTASAGYQVEGNSTNADFWQWEQQEGHIVQNQKSGRACDWWIGQRWQEDFDRAAADGQTMHRMSVEWSRIEPKPGQWDGDALDHYRQMVKGLRSRGIEPVVTLHHFANPIWLTERNAWETGEVVLLFETYVRRVVKALKEDVRWWCTINEPNGYMLAGWGTGVFPPGIASIASVFTVAQNILKAHIVVYRTIHGLQPEAMVGIPVHFRPIMPARPSSHLDQWVARLYFNFFSNLYIDAIHTGKMRRLWKPSISIPGVKDTMDYFALNYYTADVVQFDLTQARYFFGKRSFPPEAKADDTNFYASYPPGFYYSLKWASQFGLPILVTENGIGDKNDRLRPRHIMTHLRELWRAIEEHIDVRGYLHWSLVDNFEWIRGWTHRFGLYELDTETLVRTPRLSAFLYADICHANALTPEITSKYVPGVFSQIFPAQTGGLQSMKMLEYKSSGTTS